MDEPWKHCTEWEKVAVFFVPRGFQDAAKVDTHWSKQYIQSGLKSDRGGRDISLKMTICGCPATVGMGVRHDCSIPGSAYVTQFSSFQSAASWYAPWVLQFQDTGGQGTQQTVIWMHTETSLDAVMSPTLLLKFHLKFDSPLPENPKLCPKSE